MGTNSRLGLRLKFGIFISGLMIISTFLTGYLLISKLSSNQTEEIEAYLKVQGEAADSILILNYFDISITSKESFINYWGSDYSKSFKEVTAQSFILYDNHGEEKSKFYQGNIVPDTDMIMDMAISGKIAYYQEGNNIIYYWPLKNGVEQVGVLVIIYDISDRMNFIDSVKSGYVYLGIGMAFVSILISYLYFSNHIKKIGSIIEKIKRIENGDFSKTSPVGSNDEISILDDGVESMRSSIESFIETINTDKKELSNALERLSISDEKQKLFFNSITHEFKTPLSIIMAHSDLIEMYDDPTMRTTSVENIKNEAKRLHQMIESALELSSIDRYEYESVSEYIDIYLIADEILDRMFNKAEKFNIHLERKLESCMINVDREMLEHILINVVDNAIKYNVSGGRVLICGIESADGYSLIVEDSGSGIPEEDWEKVFEEFYVVDKSRSKKSGGTGLGLSIVKKYLDKLGGSVEIENSTLGGAKVTIKLNKVYNHETIG